MDTTPRDGPEIGFESADPGWAGSVRLLVALVVLMGLAFVVMAATHQPGCGGG
jgi:hypothetical protein